MFPNLLYISDVPVESSYHGSALLFRLLDSYPQDQLFIMESGQDVSKAERRLPGVNYCQAPPLRLSRLLTTRVHRLASLLLTAVSERRWRFIQRLTSQFNPQAILAVAHGYGWLSAAAFARKRQLPLHLIVHDDWPTFTPAPSMLRPWAAEKFAAVYRQAASRLCVSPYMMERYQHTCGVPGTVLLPSRANNSTVFSAPPARLTQQNAPLTGLFGGSLTSPSYIRSLGTLARMLQPVGGRVLIYGPTPKSQAAIVGVNEPNLEWRGLVPPEEMIRIAREEADFLFVPMSFEASDLKTMEINFPSKLADYTAIGLPLLIAGPPSTSAVKWAEDNPGVAEVVRDDSAESLGRAISRLSDPSHRMSLASAAIEAGARQFSHQAAAKVFLDRVMIASKS
ncbi:glycosyltransferase [Roseimicrobium sp. ORNL1]|uniref:glycosyltransferase n=1 Tax=Roseimicrobium sp. ORNL1 TaxID=2711231 RepID=UPI0013E0FFC3|nr:glycosyltransferase [Roseimicrobium sp. ORNL1]QIF04479.1 glycosyltransferase family 4 protein [Roseimicrobium sp. ORNL1]